MDAFFNGMESGIGLEVVIWIQAHSSAWADALAVLLYRLGGYPVYLVMFSVLYWSLDKRLAKRFLVALILSGLLVAALKLGLERPRPYVAFPDEVYALTHESTYGFPSGHVGITLPVLGVIAAWVRRWRAWLLWAGYVALMAWARMAAGVHYPQDIVGGLIIGLVVLGWVERYSEGVTRWWASVPHLMRGVLLTLAASLITAFLWRDLLDIVIAGVILGAGTGFMVDERRIHFSTAGTAAQRLTRALVGVVLVGVLAVLVLVIESRLAFPTLFQMAGYAVVSFVVVALYPYAAVRAGLAGRDDIQEA